MAWVSAFNFEFNGIGIHFSLFLREAYHLLLDVIMKDLTPAFAAFVTPAFAALCAFFMGFGYFMNERVFYA